MPQFEHITLIIESLPGARAQVQVNIPTPTPGMRLETPAHALAIDALGWLGKQPAVAGFVYGGLHTAPATTEQPNADAAQAAHIVLDLETLSTDPHATVASIGAVALTAQGKWVAEFHQVIATGEQPNRHICPNTREWWDKQSSEAKAASILASNPASPIQALKDFTEWVLQHADPKTVKVWGNGSGFDNVILASLFADYPELKKPWAFWNDRDMRTVLDLNPSAKDVGPFEGVKHNALHDARHEAKQLTKVLMATHSTQQGLDALTDAARCVIAERTRQISAEGYTPEQDDGYNPGVLALHGGLYACHAYDNLTKKRAPEGWQWDEKWWKPKDPRSNLVKAGALVLAEIERMDRSFAAQAKQGAAA